MTRHIYAEKFIPPILMYSGLIPFIAGALLLLLEFPVLPVMGNVSSAMASYGLVIVVFLTGIHWGQKLSPGRSLPGLYISSNILAVATWLAWLVLPVKYFLVFLSAPLAIMLAIDHSLYRLDILEKNYFLSRSLITGIVVLCLFLGAFSI